VLDIDIKRYVIKLLIVHLYIINRELRIDWFIHFYQTNKGSDLLLCWR